MTGRLPTRWSHPSPGPTRGPDSGGSVNKRHWSAASGLAVGALVVTGLPLPMQAQAAPGGAEPRSAATPLQPRPRDRTTCPTRSPRPHAAERKDAVAKLAQGRGDDEDDQRQPRHRGQVHGQGRQGRQVEVRQLPGEPRGGHLHDPRRLRHADEPAASAARPGRCTTRSPRPTATGTATRPTTTRPTGSPDFNRDALPGPDVRRAASRSRTSTSSSPTAASWPRATSPTG